MRSIPDQHEALDDIQTMRDAVRSLAHRAEQHRAYLLSSSENGPLPPIPAVKNGNPSGHPPSENPEPPETADHLTGPCPVAPTPED